MLFIDWDQTQTVKLHFFFDKRMHPDDKIASPRLIRPRLWRLRSSSSEPARSTWATIRSSPRRERWCRQHGKADQQRHDDEIDEQSAEREKDRRRDRGRERTPPFRACRGPARRLICWAIIGKAMTPAPNMLSWIFV